MVDKYYSEEAPHRVVTRKPDAENARLKGGLLKRRQFIVNAIGAAALASTTAAFAQGPEPPPSRPADPSPTEGHSFDRARLLCMMRGALAHAVKERNLC
jgi:hypothetical protein